MPTPRKTLSKEDKEMWSKIFHYVEREILGYDENQHLQKMAVLTLKGLQDGKAIANNKTNPNGSYSLKVVYGAIVLSKPAFLQAKRTKDFKDERAQVAYFCAIVRNQLNPVYEAYVERQRQDEVFSKIAYDEKHKGVEYKPKRNTTKVSQVSGAFW